MAAFDRAIANGQEKLAIRQFDRAKAEAAAYRSPAVADLDLERARWDLKSAGTAGAPITLAARFGDGTMDEDMEAVLEDLAELNDDE